MNTFQQTPRRARQAGFTLVEMMVAITIGLIVMFGVTTTFVNLKSTFKSQDKLGQLQDNERVALTFLTNAINEAGYYPDPKSASTITTSTAPSTSPASPGGTMPALVGVFGTADGGSATTPESLQTAFSTIASDGLMSCIGTNYAGASTVTVRNIFYVDSSTNSLMCRVLVNGLGSDTMANGGTPQILATGVSKMQVMYGLASAGTQQVNVYVAPGDMTASLWSTVKAVRITLTLPNPFGGTDISRTHTINVMN